ncbi:unnamed protein product [Anisakis simplex]|uniref:Protein kinase domain-containing protein n=1 Tax=Anisakis simplex TaxID=6269 RepID=A0A0M3J2M0_ANISI|nr:unnamed protein product [Anisakis simplex]
MDLVEGASLRDHINSVKEKNETFTEARIWNIVIQLVLALRYLHKEKRIVHRDLKPNNIMLADNDHVVITDFGLAKEKGADYLKSAAGTIVYSCPEIVQNEPYSDKADVWSFGCCVYEMCNLKPAFFSHNVLRLATTIVEGRYEMVDQNYSPELRRMINACLEKDHRKRSDIVGISSLITERIMLHLDGVLRSISTTSKTVASKSDRRQRNDTSTSKNSKNTEPRISSRLIKANRFQRSQSDAKSLLPLRAFGIDKPRKDSSIESTSSSSCSNSVRLPNLHQIVRSDSIENERRLALERHLRVASAGAVLNVSANSVQPITDPVLEILDMAHR